MYSVCTFTHCITVLGGPRMVTCSAECPTRLSSMVAHGKMPQLGWQSNSTRPLFCVDSRPGVTWWVKMNSLVSCGLGCQRNLGHYPSYDWHIAHRKLIIAKMSAHLVPFGIFLTTDGDQCFLQQMGTIFVVYVVSDLWTMSVTGWGGSRQADTLAVVVSTLFVLLWDAHRLEFKLYIVCIYINNYLYM